MSRIGAEALPRCLFEEQGADQAKATMERLQQKLCQLKCIPTLLLKAKLM
jgi:hypothetical protein